jgi:hypothetical protein
MGAKGTATVDFGATGGDYATVTVTGQTSIGAGSAVEAWMMRESTSDNTADEHSIAPIRLTCGDIVAGTGFTIHAVSDWRLFGTFAVHWVWD